MASHFQRHQDYLDITSIDILCVTIAGLCHDLGHGPFSHVFDGVFMKRMNPDSHWRHEDGSVNMFNHLLTANSIDLSEYGLSAVDKTFIEEIINGTDESARKGRSFEKFYLYDIVNNTRSGLDVDKLDYFQRDMKYTNAAFACKFERFIELGKIMQAEPIAGTATHTNRATNNQPFFSPTSLFNSASKEKESKGSPASTVTEEDCEAHPYMICYPEKLVREAVELFALRFRLHQLVYTHTCVKKIEFMITDALEIADPFVDIRGSVSPSHPEGKYRMSECVHDSEALSNLNDGVLYLIESSWDERLKPAQEIIARIRKRELYSCLGKSAYARGGKLDRTKDRDITLELVALSEQLAFKAQAQASSEYTLSASTATSTNNTEDSDKSSSGATKALFASSAEEEMFGGIHSQDSAADLAQLANNSKPRTNKLKRVSSVKSTSSVVLAPSSSGWYDPTVSLTASDLIVEKMNIHYGQKHKNPVDHMRFFPKDCDPKTEVARQLNQQNYETSLPRVFEECAIRVFCRDPSKVVLARNIYAAWCKQEQANTPFPSLSQSVAYFEEEDEEEEVYDEEEDVVSRRSEDMDE
eukprot:gene24574-30939_t